MLKRLPRRLASTYHRPPPGGGGTSWSQKFGDASNSNTTSSSDGAANSNNNKPKESWDTSTNKFFGGGGTAEVYGFNKEAARAQSGAAPPRMSSGGGVAGTASYNEFSPRTGETSSSTLASILMGHDDPRAARRSTPLDLGLDIDNFGIVFMCIGAWVLYAVYRWDQSKQERERALEEKLGKLE
eukprot:PhM_4_TR18660/c2_g3_i1/m.19881